jgi:magnesium transporter
MQPMRQLTSLLLPELKQALKDSNEAAARDVVEVLHPADIADLLIHLEDDEALTLFRALDLRRRAEVFEHLGEYQEDLIERIGPQLMAGVINEMSSDDRAWLMRELPEAVRNSLLPLMAQAERDDVKRLLAHEEDTAGSIMSTEYATVQPQMTVAQALEHLRREAPNRETIYTVYVVDEQRQLVGVVSLQELILASPQKRIEDLMLREPVSATVETDQEEVARTMAKYDFLALPIVDAEKRMVGIVTYDDIFDILQEEHQEDAELSAAVVPTEISYNNAGALHLVRKRVGWLMVLLVAAFLSSTVISRFEGALEAVVALAFFIPVLIDAGGNTGSQSATLVIRGMATGDLHLRDWLRVLSKELLVGLILGAALGLMLFLWGSIWSPARTVAPVVGLTMIVLVLWANLVGAMMPLVLSKLRLDPAVASAPLITTVVDATGLLIYFSIAVIVLDI